MAKYRKKPVVVEAEQWFPGRRIDGVEEHPRVLVDNADLQTMHPTAFIHTLEGTHMVIPGDYIITGIAGEKYPCKEAIFLATYEQVEEALSE